MYNRVRHLREVLTLRGERGQAIIIIAFVAIALFLFAGLALDAAAIYAGQSRLKRAVDAAALAGVVELPNEDAAQTRVEQFMLINGFDPDDPQVMVPPFNVERVPTVLYLQLAVTATYRVPLNFLPIINFDYVEVTESAVAEYRSLVEAYTSQTGGTGIVGRASLFTWGRWANPKFGDAFTPQCYTCDGADCDVYGAGRYVCPNGANPDHKELYNESGEGYPFRIHIPAGYSADELQIEIFDPDGWNQPIVDEVEIWHTDGISVTGSDTIPLNEIDCNEHATGNQNERMDPCLIATGDVANPYWFMRVDETRSFGSRPSGYSSLYNTETHYRLFYLKQLPGQSIIRTPISTYVGKADNSDNTDMDWVTAWTLDVNCDDGGCDVPYAVQGSDGSFSLILEVDGVTGYSKNGFDLWAGPPSSEPIPPNVNERNLYLLENRDAHDPDEVVIYGSGYLPLSVHATDQISITYALIPIPAAGFQIDLFHFDNDALEGELVQEIDYYLEGVEGWQESGILSLDGTWSTTDPYVYQQPGIRHHDTFAIPDSGTFAGAYLHGVYTPRYVQTAVEDSTWRLEYEGPVGDTYVRLIE